jgi:hypothetical protein
MPLTLQLGSLQYAYSPTISVSYWANNYSKQSSATVELFYDGEVPPQGLFDAFFAIPHTWQRLDETWKDRQLNLPGHNQTYRFGRPNGVDDIPEKYR